MPSVNYYLARIFNVIVWSSNGKLIIINNSRKLWLRAKFVVYIIYWSVFFEFKKKKIMIFSTGSYTVIPVGIVINFYGLPYRQTFFLFFSVTFVKTQYILTITIRKLGDNNCLKIYGARVVIDGDPINRPRGCSDYEKFHGRPLQSGSRVFTG